MNVLVTGATGFVGKPLVRRLMKAGHTVTVLTRDPRRAAKLLPARVRCERWEPGRDGLDENLLKGMDAVVHLAGEGVADARWSEARKRAIVASRVDSTRAIVDAVAKLPAAERPRCLVSTSAIGIYGDRGDERLEESSSNGEGFLADVCVAWESEAQAAVRLGVRTVIIRVGIVLGSQGGALAKMLPPFRLGAGGRLGAGNQWMSWIHIDDLVELFALAVENEAVSGVLNGTAPHPVTNSEFTTVLGATLGRPVLLPAPAAALKLALGEMSIILLASQRVYPARPGTFGFRFRYSELSAALANLLATADKIFEREQWVPHPLADVFAFFSDAHNLEALTPEFLHFKVLSTSTAALGEGTLINYRLSLHGLPMHWQSRIEEWQPGKKFVDQQIKGPYSLWQHTHEFEAVDGGTLIRDRVRYRLPLGALGDLVAGGFVGNDLERIFDYRYATIAERFGARSAENKHDAPSVRRAS